MELAVNGERALRFEPGIDNGDNPSPNLIGGSPDNEVLDGVHSASIAGGGRSDSVLPDSANLVTDSDGTIGGGAGNQAGEDDGATDNQIGATVSGGIDNTASGTRSTVSGGAGNTAGGPFDAVAGGASNTATGVRATVGGGLGNTASDISATVTGGHNNTADGHASTVSGGFGNAANGEQSAIVGGAANEANGLRAFVAGGYRNAADGDYSFAAGRQAKNAAGHNGVFLFADSTSEDFDSVTFNEFAVRASGGVRLRTSSDLSTGCTLPPSSGSWVCTSDVRTKRDFEDVDSGDVLDRLAEMPVRSWRFKGEDRSVRHLGPTAQDFHRAFGLGKSRTGIGLLDSSGVALAAIKGLNEELRAERRRNSELAGRLAQIESRLDRLEKGDE